MERWVLLGFMAGKVGGTVGPSGSQWVLAKKQINNIYGHAIIWPRKLAMTITLGASSRYVAAPARWLTKNIFMVRFIFYGKADLLVELSRDWVLIKIKGIITYITAYFKYSPN